MEEVRIAIVGMGIGRANARGFLNTPRARIVALCDIDEERMHKLATELKIPEPLAFYTDYREMCRDRSIDAVFVGTPNQLHVPVALEAVRNDKHVLSPSRSQMPSLRRATWLQQPRRQGLSI